MRRTLLLSLLATLAFGATAQARDPLEVRSAVIQPDQHRVAFTVVCHASAAQCAGVLRTSSFGDVPLTRPRRVRLRPGVGEHVTLRLREGALRGIAEAGPEPDGQLTLTDRTGHRLVGWLTYRARVSCRTGTTIVSSAYVRTFRLAGFGVYGCLRSAGRPVLLSYEDDSIAPHSVDAVKVAGRFVAFSTTVSWKCTAPRSPSTTSAPRRIRHTRTTSTTVDGSANGCIGTTGVVAMVLRPSGSVAWTEAPGDAGTISVFTIDHTGDHTLATGPDLAPTSLHSINPTTITWTRGGRHHTGHLR